MKFWVRFSRTIFKLAASPWLKKARAKSLESVLLKSTDLLEPEMLSEMQSFIRFKQTSEGSFMDRAGNGDLYYSLFGCFVAEALNVPDVKMPLRTYIRKTVMESNLTGVHLYCGAILYGKLWGMDDVSEKLRKQVMVALRKEKSRQSEYTDFLGILALYYLEDFPGIRRIVNQYKSFSVSRELPCSVTAAISILLEIAGKPDIRAEEKLKSFYRRNGGFAAVKQAPAEDLLSTSVALFALHFMSADMRKIKPDCLSFIDDLYLQGGFRSMQVDFETDVEYTFYGLLALGALA
jgi:hypothetical protein